MRSLIFEGNTWTAYEELRERDKKLHKALRKILKYGDKSPIDVFSNSIGDLIPISLSNFS